MTRAIWSVIHLIGAVLFLMMAARITEAGVVPALPVAPPAGAAQTEPHVAWPRPAPTAQN